MPIRNAQGRVIGVSQLVNKKDGTPFNKNDENLFEVSIIFFLFYLFYIFLFFYFFFAGDILKFFFPIFFPENRHLPFHAFQNK